MKLAIFTILTASAALAQNAQTGKQLYEKYGCYTCHGHLGQGGAGAKLTPNTMAAVALTAYVRKPAGTMPPYTAKVISDAELADIRAYLASIPAPPPLKEIPLLNP